MKWINDKQDKFIYMYVYQQKKFKNIYIVWWIITAGKYILNCFHLRTGINDQVISSYSYNTSGNFGLHMYPQNGSLL